MCDSTVKVEIHHIRALRDLNVKGQRGKAQVGATHGGTAAQDPRGLPYVPHGHPPRAIHSAEADINHWRAGCGESRTSGSDGG